MDALSLSSSNSISKPMFHNLRLSNNQKRLSPMQFSVSCRSSTNTISQTNGNNFYNMLSLCPKSATMDDIKKAYRSMALRYHPDVCHDVSKKEESTKMFVQLNAAYNTLSNPKLRAEYDSELLGYRGQRSASVGDEYENWRCKWQEQMVELKRRCHRGVAQKEGSWGSRMRAKNMNMNYQN
ncbi:unnamed protein product [Lupinus luteus]|uniref:J domain-containing protein n=1 Tax=Lupinus luteus TaxID=3873 RepID=A0AAV1WJG6_LUPLU